MAQPKVNIRRLKDFAFKEIPRDNLLREILLGERDELEITEFTSKIDIWLRLLRRAHT
jgi:hypothetical protein